MTYYMLFMILDCRNNVKTKSKSEQFFEFKMDHTAAETNHNINSAFGPGTANGVEHSGGSRSFAEETRALKMRSVVATIGSWQWPVESNHWRLSSYSYTVDYQGTQHWPFCGQSAFEANWEGALWADCRSKKLSYWSVIFSYSLQQWPVSLSDCDMWQKVDFIL